MQLAGYGYLSEAISPIRSNAMTTISPIMTLAAAKQSIADLAAEMPGGKLSADGLSYRHEGKVPSISYPTCLTAYRVGSGWRLIDAA